MINGLMRTQSKWGVKSIHYLQNNKGNWCLISLYLGPFNTTPLCNVFLLETPVKEGEKTCQFSMSHSHFFLSFFDISLSFRLDMRQEREEGFYHLGSNSNGKLTCETLKNKVIGRRQFFVIPFSRLEIKRQKTKVKRHSLCGQLSWTIFFDFWSTDPCKWLMKNLYAFRNLICLRRKSIRQSMLHP